MEIRKKERVDLELKQNEVVEMYIKKKPLFKVIEERFVEKIEKPLMEE